MGAGEAHDSLWWANAYILDDSNNKIPLKLKVHSFDIDTAIELPSHPNIFYSNKDFNNTGLKENSIDLVWSHNSFQCSKNPLATLAHWWYIMRKDAMLCLTIPNNFQLSNLDGTFPTIAGAEFAVFIAEFIRDPQNGHSH
jgi:trans-aconitate methyltransferase